MQVTVGVRPERVKSQKSVVLKSQICLISYRCQEGCTSKDALEERENFSALWHASEQMLKMHVEIGMSEHGEMENKPL